MNDARSAPGMTAGSAGSAAGSATARYIETGRMPAWLAGGSLLGALAASSCCILPVALFSLGIGGAWIANFTQLAPYKPYFIVATLALLGTGYWLTRRAAKAACSPDTACARPTSHRVVNGVFAAAAVLVAAAFAFDYVAPYVL